MLSSLYSLKVQAWFPGHTVNGNELVVGDRQEGVVILNLLTESSSLMVDDVSTVTKSNIYF